MKIPRTIFVIWNDSDFIHMVSLFFQGHGYSVLAAHSLADAAEIYLQQPPDLFLLERTIDEPDDAINFCTRIKMTSTLAHIPIVVMNVDIKLAQEFDPQLLFDSGANAIFGKVFDISRLLETVQILLENPQMTGLIDRALL